jgi:hypothetical protein
MSNYKDLKLDKFKDTTDIVDSGTEGTKVAVGTTAQRGSTTGQWRYNSTTNFFEGRAADGSFIGLEPVPSVLSSDVTEVDSNAGGNQTFVIGGTNFTSGGTISFIGNAGTDFNATSTTLNSGSQITAVAPKSSFLNAQEPYKVKFTSATGASGQSGSGLISVDTAPTFGVASGTLGTLFDAGRAGSNLTTVTTTDADGDAITLSITSGALPTGLTLNDNGTFSGTANAVGSDTTYNFTITATANSKTTDRAYSITVNAPAYAVFNSNGTWNVPTGVTTVQALVVAGGGSGGTTSGAGGGGNNRGAGGGAGGLIFIPSWDVTGASSYAIVVGNGGSVSYNTSQNGGDSTVSGGSKTLTAIGGGKGGHGDSTNNKGNGGSGGSPWYPTYSGGTGTQPTNTSDGVNTYNSTGYGNDGGNSSSSAPYGGGGGGATSRGQHYNEGQQGGTGFDGNSYGLGSYGESGYFASGGTAATHQGTNTNTRIGGGGAGYNNSTNMPSNSAANGQANTGGGGGSGGNGGSGVVIFKY